MACAPLEGYAIYIWHCDRSGNYSLYSSGVQNENYLRGVQVTDANGQVTFTSIFPACYSGRYPHIHFEIYPSLAAATSYLSSVLISQMALPLSICQAVYDNATGYSQSVTNLAAVSTSTDNVFASSTAAQIAQQTPSLAGSVTAGYTGTILIGVGA
jgi:protocatechuate 3,4-dioxygenase beta subunit